MESNGITKFATCIFNSNLLCNFQLSIWDLALERDPEEEKD